MTRKRITLAAIPLVLAIAAGLAVGQRQGRGRGPVVIPEDRAGVPDWKVDDHFKNDVFTFVRVEYSDGGYGRRGGGGFGGFGGFGGGGGGRRGRWSIDFPDSDLNFSYRLQQLTSLKVNPNPIHMPLTDEKLFDYPFLYLIEPGALLFNDEEIVALRRYLLNGGFMMVDDFWGNDEYENFHQQMKRVFPDKEPEELPIDHEIFRCVYKLKEKPQVPSMDHYLQTGLTYEPRYSNDTQEVHYRGINDDKGRLMVIICHNTDLGDGWEREGQSHEYFKEFSEKKSYPMGINIITYAMTH